MVTPPKARPRIGLKGYWTVTVTGWLVISELVSEISSVGCNGLPAVLVLIGMVVLIETVAWRMSAAAIFLATAPTIVGVMVPDPDKVRSVSPGWLRTGAFPGVVKSPHVEGPSRVTSTAPHLAPARAASCTSL